MDDLWRLRDDFARLLKNAPGVISVGVGRDNGEVVLVVVVDSDEFRQVLPDRYRGVAVKVRQLGAGESHSQVAIVT